MANSALSLGLNLGFGLLIFAGAAALGAASVVGQARAVSRLEQAREGNLRLTGEDAVAGGEISLELGPGQKHWVLAFVSVRCLCSPDQLLALKDLDARFAREGFKFVAVDVSQDSTQEERMKYYRDFSFPIIRDQGFKISDRFSAKKTPWIQVLNAAGTSVYTGTVLDQEGDALLEPALNAISAGREPAHVKDKRFGCAIRTFVVAPDSDDEGGAEHSRGHEHSH